MAQNQYPSYLNQQPNPNSHLYQRSSYNQNAQQPPSSYTAPSQLAGQSYDPRVYQPQQPQQRSLQSNGFSYTSQQPQQRLPYSQQVGYSQPPIQVQQSPYTPQPQSQTQTQAVSAVQPRIGPAGFNSQSIAYNKSLTKATGSQYVPAPLPSRMMPSSFPAPIPHTSQPSSSQFAANQSRRPLPTPKPRPESMPPPSRQPPLIQAPAPSRPVVLTSTIPSSVSSSSADTISAASPTSTSSHGSRRPLPTPLPRSVRHGSLDLHNRTPSPVKNYASIHNADQPANPAADSSQSMPPAPASQLSNIPAGTKFVPLWKRNLNPSPAPASSGISKTNMERRSTVSGVGANINDFSERSDGPKNVPLTLEKSLSFSTRRPLPASPTTSPDISKANSGSNITRKLTLHARVPASSGKEDEMASTDISSDEENQFRQRNGMGQGTRVEQARTPSPQYGIRDLPGRSRTIINRAQTDDYSSLPPSPEAKQSNTRTRPVRSATLPQPPAARPPIDSEQHAEGTQSLTLRLASMALQEDREPDRQPAGPTRNSPTKPPWPAHVPPLPRTPTVPSQPFSPIMNASMAMSGRQREFVNLDDAPPPSLRRSPSPIRQPASSVPSINVSHAPTQQNKSDRQSHWAPPVNGTNSYTATPKIEAPASPAKAEQRPDIPRISLPDDDDGDDSDDHDFGPTISISSPDPPRISVSNPGQPNITVSTPKMSISEPSFGVLDPSIPSIQAFPPAVSSQDQPQFGSRHTHYEEQGGAKRGLPPPPIRRPGELACGGCGGPIIGRIVSAMGLRWHPACFKCTVCNELLEHVSSYEHEGRPYCHLDYHENFAPRCYHCKTSIIDERFITLDDPALGKRTYHEQHFFCAECGDPFLAPSGASTRTGELSVTGDGMFEDDDVGFTVYKGHPYCEACHVRLRMPKCKRCKKSIRDGTRAVEALGGKWCWECFVCSRCENPFENPSFFLRDSKPFCEPCFSLMLRNEV